MEPASEALFFHKNDPDDPRLGEVVQRWTGGAVTFRAGQPVLLGFPCDEGVRRNGGRVGAAQAPDTIRRQLYRMTTWHGSLGIDLAAFGLLDVGNVRMGDDLELSQQRLGTVIGELLRAKTVPVLLGGGHETTYGHYLGYAEARMECAILNIDAHLDVRAYPKGGHSGSPFRQAMEHPQEPLRPGCYTVVGAQPQSVARAHLEFVEQHGGKVYWTTDVWTADQIGAVLTEELQRLRQASRSLLITIDADAFCQGDVPGVSAPNATGLAGAFWPSIAYQAGISDCVTSLDLVEVNPAIDRDDQTAQWAAVGIRQFLLGLVHKRVFGLRAKG
jgi:formiminoglutamase